MSLHRLFKNTTYVLVAKLTNSAFSFAVVLIVARALSVHEVGLYTFFLSLSAFLVFLSSWGGNELLFRRGAAKPKLIKSMLLASGITRAVIGFVLGSAVILNYLIWLNNSEHALLFFIGFTALMLDTQTVAYIMGSRARGDMLLEGWVYTGRGALKAILVTLVCWYSPSVGQVMLAILLANLVGLLVVHWYERTQYQAQSMPISGRYIKVLLRQSTHYFLMGLLSVVGAQADVLLLGMLSSNTEVGYFAIPLQIYQTLLFVPVAFNVALQPLLVKTYQKEPYRWKSQVLRLSVGIIIIAILATVMLVVTMPIIVPWVFAETYMTSADIVTVLMLAFGLRLFVVTVVQTAYVSANRVGLFNTRLAVTLAAHIGASVLLIQMLGPVGAAWGILLGDALLLIFGFYDFWRKYLYSTSSRSSQAIT